MGTISEVSELSEQSELSELLFMIFHVRLGVRTGVMTLLRIGGHSHHW
jgi:hypothetical protein